jgi:hypothetical protein
MNYNTIMLDIISFRGVLHIHYFLEVGFNLIIT